jgi:hypothetical protein
MPSETDISEELAKRMLQQYGDDPTEDAVDDTEVVDKEVSEAVTESPPPASIKDVFAKEGFEVGELDEETLAKQVIEQLKSRQELESRAREAEEALARIKLEAQQKAAPAEQEKKETPTEALKRWAKVSFDPDHEAATEYDPTSGMYKGKSKFGHFGTVAAEELNKVMREKKRRADILVSDPVKAMEEAGLLDEIYKKIEERVTGVKASIEESIAKQRADEASKSAAQAKEADAIKFQEEHKAELFKLDQSGNPLRDITGKSLVLTPLGEYVREIASEMQAGGADNQTAIKTAYKLAKKAFTQTPAQPPEDKKKAFLDKGRKSNVQQTTLRASVAQAHQDDAPRRFRDLVLTDPDNAEALGELYRGQ